MKHPVSLSIFFPAYNEEENIAEIIERAAEVAECSPLIERYEIIVINDGSSDRTGAVAEEAAERLRNVRIIHHPENRGYGAALITGLRAAMLQYVFFTDADLQFDLGELERLLVHAEEHPVVIGFRAPRQDPFMRLLNAAGWNALNRTLFGLKIRDIDCAFKLFRRDLIRETPLRSQGAMISAELLIRLTRRGVRIKEVPVTHLPRRRGSPTGAKPSVILRALREMMSLYWGDLGLPSQKEALKFMMVGVINTLVDALSYFAMTREIFLLDPVSAKFLSFLFGTVSSFFLNRFWTFGIRGRLAPGELMRFYAAVSASLALNVGAMYIFVHIAHFYDLFALGFTTVLTFGFNFAISKLWVFKKKEDVSGIPELARAPIRS